MLDSKLASVLQFLCAMMNSVTRDPQLQRELATAWIVQAKDLCTGQLPVSFLCTIFIVQDRHSDCHCVCGKVPVWEF